MELGWPADAVSDMPLVPRRPAANENAAGAAPPGLTHLRVIPASVSSHSLNVIADGRRQEIDLVLHCQHRGVLGEQRERRIAARAVCDGAGRARVKVAVLLGHFRPTRQHDVHTSWCNVRDVCTEMAHQSLPFKTGSDACLDLGACLFRLRLVVHGSPWTQRSWLVVERPPPYAAKLNPVEGSWSSVRASRRFRRGRCCRCRWRPGAGERHPQRTGCDWGVFGGGVQPPAAEDDGAAGEHGVDQLGGECPGRPA